GSPHSWRAPRAETAEAADPGFTTGHRPRAGIDNNRVRRDVQIGDRELSAVLRIEECSGPGVAAGCRDGGKIGRDALAHLLGHLVQRGNSVRMILKEARAAVGAQIERVIDLYRDGRNFPLFESFQSESGGL